MKPIVSFMLMMACLPFAAAAQSKTIDYGKDILPILSGNCFECHGPDEKAREADLRLDTAEGAYADLFGAVAVSPGDPENSELIYRINVRDKDEVMPPPDSKKSLTDQEKDLLRRWIKEGGEYDTHWAWKVPAKQPLPTVAKHPVDAWILSRLEQEGLQPSPPADPYMLLRRIYLDLIGMPPNPDEIESFLTACKSDSEKAVTRVIDDLMGRPAFGEKWARHWLDVARYADTNGFEKDKPRDQWVYREWVIKALNEDMPYDEFLIEQLAGDLIPNHTQDQLIASGFMRNGMVNEEGAIIPEQFRIEGIFDRMDCFGKATLGLTLQCAQCHTHKFDPITQDEYYGLFAFFNETYEAKSWIYSDKQLKKISSIQTKVAELENRVKAEVPNWKSELAAWESEQKANNDIWTIWDPDVHIWEGGLNHPEELEDHSILTLGHPTVTGNSVTEGNTNLPVITGIRLEALRHGDQPFRGPGRSYWGTFAISEMKVFAQLPDAEDWTKIDLSEATADFATEIGKLKRYFRHEKLDPDNERTVGPASFIADGDTKTGWAPDRGPILRHTESAVVVQFKDPLNLPEGSRLKVQLTQSHGGDGNDRENQQLGRYRFAFTDSPDPKATTYDHAAVMAMQKNEANRTPEDEAAIFKAWRLSRDDLQEINGQIADLEKGYPEARTSVLHSAPTDPGFERTTTAFVRGVWNKPSHEVERGTPAILNSMQVNDPTRLDLAHWVTSDEAPLTARVQVNRVWQAIFGKGLVETPEDFGTRAPKPIHLDLLDWLAVDFRENGWSMKNLIRKIMTSKVYQQTSQFTSEALEKDPNNVFLSRGPRFRAEAEVVRDIALASSGLLHEEIGGPSVFPPVPESVLKDNYFIPEYWAEEQDEQRYRRSLYLFRKRAMPDPTLSSFDAPNGDFSCVRRIRSNTPLSALTSLNEPVFVEASQALALRILNEARPGEDDRVNYGYLLTTGRPANQMEIQEVLNLIDSQKQRLAEGWLDIREIGFKDPDHLPELPEGITPRDVAGWTIASRVLLNLDETITKN